jgi:signal recognition particle subunit SRP54
MGLGGGMNGMAGMNGIPSDMLPEGMEAPSKGGFAGLFGRKNTETDDGPVTPTGRRDRKKKRKGRR